MDDETEESCNAFVGLTIYWPLTYMRLWQLRTESETYGVGITQGWEANVSNLFKQYKA